MTLADPLLAARALVLNDLTAQGRADPHTVSVVEDCVAHRRWWLEQWEAGAGYVAGLVAQDVQDALSDEATRWPVCPRCRTHAEHSLGIEPELGDDPHWVCTESGEFVADLGQLPPYGCSQP